jgi:hypothetical protein
VISHFFVPLSLFWKYCSINRSLLSFWCSRCCCRLPMSHSNSEQNKKEEEKRWIISVFSFVRLSLYMTVYPNMLIHVCVFVRRKVFVFPLVYKSKLLFVCVCSKAACLLLLSMCVCVCVSSGRVLSLSLSFVILQRTNFFFQHLQSFSHIRLNGPSFSSRVDVYRCRVHTDILSCCYDFFLFVLALRCLLCLQKKKRILFFLLLFLLLHHHHFLLYRLSITHLKINRK